VRKQNNITSLLFTTQNKKEKSVEIKTKTETETETKTTTTTTTRMTPIPDNDPEYLDITNINGSSSKPIKMTTHYAEADEDNITNNGEDNKNNLTDADADVAAAVANSTANATNNTTNNTNTDTTTPNINNGLYLRWSRIIKTVTIKADNSGLLRGSIAAPTKESNESFLRIIAKKKKSSGGSGSGGSGGQRGTGQGNGNGNGNGNATTTKKNILKEVSGYAAPGEIVAMMG
jgi:hypothetical protein